MAAIVTGQCETVILRLFNVEGLPCPHRACMLTTKEVPNKSPSEMKRKAHGAQEPEHMGYM
ncbi:hypothetical protein DU490_11110 [Halomonas sp. DQ26W]|nr:hypothetical protein DU490_11110 [Halomonas sp. DQ26W]